MANNIFAPPTREELNKTMFAPPTKDEMSSPPTEDVHDSGGLKRGFIDALPAAGSVLGGFLGAPLGPGGVIGGGALGAMGGKALGQGIDEQFYGVEKAPLQKTKEIGQEGLLDISGAAIGRGLVGAYRGIKTAPKVIGGYLDRFGPVAKEGAEEVTKAAERLGTKTTPGMLTDNRVAQGLESSLSQSPTQTGQQYGNAYKDIQDTLKNESEGLLEKFSKTPETQAQLGAGAKSDISKQVTDKAKKLGEAFESIHADGKQMPIAPKSINAISRNITALPYAKIKGSPESAFANNISENVSSLKTLDELRNLKSYVGNTFNDRNLSPTMKNTAGEIYSRLAQLEKNTITRSTIDYMKQTRGKGLGQMTSEFEGHQIADDILKDLKSANKEYASMSKEIKNFSNSVGIGNVRNYADFVSKIQDIPDEKIVEKLFTPGNNKALIDFQKLYPSAFDKMQQSYMMGVYEKSLTKGEVSIPKLLTNVKKLSPEARSIILGTDATQKLKDIETMYNAFPARIGPSGTPQGIEYSELNLLSPKYWWNEVRDKANDWILRNPDKIKRMSTAIKPKPYLNEVNTLLRSQAVAPQAARATGLMRDE